MASTTAHHRHVLLAQPRGYCAGVEMAIRCLEIVVQRVPGTVYVYHEIVHNRQVVAHFQDRGVQFVDSLADVPVGSTLVFSAHGVSPQLRQEAVARKLRTIDATCPLVAKVHAEVVRFSAANYQIVLIGHDGHDEVLGTLGEAPERTHLVQSVEEVDGLPIEFANQPLAYLTQTTLSVDETARIVERLRARFPHIQGPPTDDICYATQNRQEAVRELAHQCDVVVVVGSRNSSNSRRLCEVARDCGVPSHLVDDADDLQAGWFEQRRTIGISAGASAPESAVQSVVRWLEQRYDVEVGQLGGGEPTRVFPLPDDLSKLSSA